MHIKSIYTPSYICCILAATLAVFILTTFFATPLADAQSRPACLRDASVLCTRADLSPGCRDQNLCSNEQDLAILNLVAVQCQSGNCTTDQQTAADQSRQQAQKGPADPVTCDAWADFLSPTCLWRGFMMSIGTALVSISAWVLAISGLIFNFVLDWTVIQFAPKIYDSIKLGIETGWTVFRDLANILIIGMFTFIAISMILGNATYGQKKLVARVLVIAVLINFSLLFTKIIIDVTHFLASEFHKAASTQVSQPTATGGNPATNNNGITPGKFTDLGIAGQYLKLTGLSGSFNTFELLKKNSNVTQSGWLTLLYGLVTALLIAGAAAVLFYASFLLVARTILLIFLMVTSSLAFATYLIPTLAEGKYGWKVWWTSLIQSAVFAPMLLMFIWLTLTIGNQLVAKSGGIGNLGNIIATPTDPLALRILVNYLIITGLLYASIRISSMFSKQIAGMDYTKGITATGMFGASRITGMLGRSTLGNMAQKSFDAMQSAGYGSSRFGRSAMRMADRMATSTYDPANNKAVRKAGGPKAITFGNEVGKDGYRGVQKKKAEESAAEGRKFGMSKDDQAAAVKKDVTRVEEVVKKEREEIAKQVASQQAIIANKAPEARAKAETEERKKQADDGSRKLIEKALEDQETKKVATETEIKTASNKWDSDLRSAQQRIASARNQITQKREQAAYERLQAGRNAEIGALQSNLSAAQEAAQRERSRLDLLDQNVTKAGDVAHKEVENAANAKIEELKKADAVHTQNIETVRSNAATKYSRASIENVAKASARDRFDTLFGAAGMYGVDKGIEKSITGYEKNQRIKDVVKTLTDEAPKSAAPTPPPSTEPKK